MPEKSETHHQDEYDGRERDHLEAARNDKFTVKSSLDRMIFDEGCLCRDCNGHNEIQTRQFHGCAASQKPENVYFTENYFRSHDSSIKSAVTKTANSAITGQSLKLSLGKTNVTEAFSSSINSETQCSPDYITENVSGLFVVPALADSPSYNNTSSITRLFFSQIPDKYQTEINKYHQSMPVTLNPYFPYRCELSCNQVHTNKILIDKQSVDLSIDSGVVLAPSPTARTPQDDETRLPIQEKAGSIIDSNPLKKKVAPQNVHNQCLAKPNVDLMYRRTKSGTRNEPLRSNKTLFKRRYRYLISEMYRSHFTQKYHTYFAVLNYYDPSLVNRQSVGIGSTFDICLELGRILCPDSTVYGETPQPGKKDAIITDINQGATAVHSRTKLPFYVCTPGVCIPGTCDPNECFARLKKDVPFGSHATTQSQKLNIEELNSVRKIRGKKFERTQYEGKKGHKEQRKATIRANSNVALPLQGSNSSLPVSPKGVTRIGSKVSVNIHFYKDKTGNASQLASKVNQSDSVHRKRRRESNTGGNQLSSSSHSKSSEVSTQSRKVRRAELKAKKDMFHKDKGVYHASKLKRQGVPSRQAVRIGSKTSFNMEFYKALPRSANVDYGFPLQKSSIKKAQSVNKQSHKTRTPKPIKCEPGVCIPDKCDPIQCYERIKGKQKNASIDTSSSDSSNATSKGSQITPKTRKNKKKKLQSGKTTITYLDKGAASMPRPKKTLHIPNRQAVRIGSKCSFNVEFYKSKPVNQRSRLYNQGVDNKTKKNKKKSKPLKCEPGVCVPGICNPNDCFLNLKTKHEGVGSDSSRDTNSSRSSLGSQAGVRMTGSGVACFCHDKSASSMRMPKPNLHDLIPKSPMVRIGSKCDFNIEFYKSTARNNFSKRDLAKKPKVQVQKHKGQYDQGDTGKRSRSLMRKNKQSPLQYDQGDIIGQHIADGKKNKTRREFECEPGVCIPHKCDPNKCFARLKLGNDVIAIADGKNIKKRREFECEPGVCIPHKCDPYKCFTRLKLGNEVIAKADEKKIKKRRNFECEPGVCIPNKCDPYECFARLKFRNEGTATEPSLGGSSNSRTSQIQTQTKKEKKPNRQKRAGKETFYKDKSASTLPRDKVPLHIPNRQVVRIGSKCSFNMEFYKNMTGNRLPGGTKEMVCEPHVCVPGKCDPRECYKRLTGKPFQSPHATGGDQLVSKRSRRQTADKPKGRQSADAGKDKWIDKPKEQSSADIGKDKRVDKSKSKSNRMDKPKERQSAEVTKVKGIDKSKERQSADVAKVKRIDKSKERQSADITKGKRVDKSKERQSADIAKDKRVDKSKERQSADIAKDKRVDKSKERQSADIAKDKRVDKSKERQSADASKEKMIKKPKKHEAPDIGEDERISKRKGRKTDEPISKPKKLKTPPDADAVRVKPTSETSQTTITEVWKCECRPKKRKKPADGDEHKQKAESSQTDLINRQIQICECKPKKEKKTPTEKHDETEASDQEKPDTVQKMEKTKLKEKQSSEKKKKEKNLDQGDNKEISHEGTSTASLATNLSSTSNDSTVATQSKIAGVNLDRKQRKKKKKEGKLSVYKEQNLSTDINNKNLTAKQLPLPVQRPRSTKKQAVGIGSRFSFNVSFFKEKVHPRSQPDAHMGRVIIMPRRVQKRRAKTGILSFIRIYFCNLLGKQTPYHQTFNQYEQSSMTMSERQLTAAQRSSDTPFLRPECYPGRISGKCNPKDCYKLLNMRSRNFQSAARGQKKVKRYECSFGFSFPNKSCRKMYDRNQYSPKTFNMDDFLEKINHVDVGTDTSGKAKSTPQYPGTNAATQSRRLPGQQLRGRIDKPIRPHVCKCIANRLRREAAKMLAAQRQDGNCENCTPYTFNLCQENLPQGRIKEQAVILGSGCGFNIKYNRKRKK